MKINKWLRLGAALTILYLEVNNANKDFNNMCHFHAFKSALTTPMTPRFISFQQT
jgi:hypothetical protein